MLNCMKSIGHQFHVPMLRGLYVNIRKVADESLGRQRKKPSSNKLVIYSTYFPQSSIHFLARCSKFCKPLTKMEIFIRPTVLHVSNDFRVGRKMAIFNFSVLGTGVSPTELDPENRVGDEDTGRRGRQFSSCLLLPGGSGNFLARTGPPRCISRGDFPSNVPKLQQQR